MIINADGTMVTHTKSSEKNLLVDMIHGLAHKKRKNKKFVLEESEDDEELTIEQKEWNRRIYNHFSKE